MTDDISFILIIVIIITDITPLSIIPYLYYTIVIGGRGDSIMIETDYAIAFRRIFTRNNIQQLIIMRAPHLPQNVIIFFDVL